jgi:hypothetical protein
VLAAVQALPERQREAIVLRELEGRSYEEIASELGVNDGSVRQLLNRARNTLRAGATAVIPAGLILRLPWMASAEPVAGRIAELGVGAGAGAVMAKLGATALVTGAVATGVAVAPELATEEHAGGAEKAAARQSPRSVEPAGVAGAGQELDSSGEGRGDGGGESRSGEGRGDRGGEGKVDRDDDRSGHRGGDDDGREPDARSGPEHGDDGQERDDRSGPGGGAEESGRSGGGSKGGGDASDDGGSGSSGSGSASSGSGSGSSGSGSGFSGSGSGSSGSGSGSGGGGSSGSSESGG